MTEISVIKRCESENFHHRATEFMQPTLSVLDIGCGHRLKPFIFHELQNCIEPHPEYVEVIKRKLSGSNAYIVPLDAQHAIEEMPDRSIDSVYLIDVIKHMPKAVGLEVLRQCERVARKQIQLFSSANSCEAEIKSRETETTAHEVKLTAREEEITIREDKITLMEAEIEVRDTAIFAKTAEIAAREAKIDERDSIKSTQLKMRFFQILTRK